MTPLRLQTKENRYYRIPFFLLRYVMCTTEICLYRKRKRMHVTRLERRVNGVKGLCYVWREIIKGRVRSACIYINANPKREGTVT